MTLVSKLLKNCLLIGIVQKASNDMYALSLPYPYKGDSDQKMSVIREALVRMPLMINLRQFLYLGDTIDDALRKSATIVGVKNFDQKAFSHLLKWAKSLDVLNPEIKIEDLVNQAVASKEVRHKEQQTKIVAFLSHSSKDKIFIRQLAADLNKANISIWLDEQMIKVGDSIAEKISQGMAESDYFLIALSSNSVESEWVKRELNNALLTEIEERKVKVLPLILNKCEVPVLIKDKKCADFSESYRAGLKELLTALKEE